MSILSSYYGLPVIPEEVLKAARTVQYWAESQDLQDWTIYGIGPRFCKCRPPSLVVINRTTEAIIGTSVSLLETQAPSQTADDDAEVYRHD